jgi:hypothetical protein
LRLLIYGVLIGLVALIVADTNLGRPITSQQRQCIYRAARYMEARGFKNDSQVALRIANSNHFRSSRFFRNVMTVAEARGGSFGFYAYTPIFSRTRIFLGGSFWDAGEIGRSSIILHELAHIRWHRERFWRGIPRHADEAQAYRRQYQTYRAIGLIPYGSDSMVFWDMMIGIKDYLLPEHPDYSRHADVRWALRQLDDEGTPVAATAIAVLYIAIATILLVGGDRLGSRIACAAFKRCAIPPLLHISEWIVVPIALLAPMIVILGCLAVAATANKANPVQTLANDLELILLAAFFLTGLVGGFLVQARRAKSMFPR